MKRSRNVTAMGWTAVIGANVGIIALTAYFVMRQENRDDCKPTVVIKSLDNCSTAFDSNFCDGIYKADDKKFLLPTWNMSLASCQADYGYKCVNGMLFYNVKPSAFAIYTSKKDNTKQLEGLYQKADNYYYADGKLAPKETTSPNCAVQQATSRSGSGSGGHWGGGGGGSDSNSRGGFGGSAHSSGS